MDQYVDRIKVSAENLAKETFPKKALELDDILNVKFVFKMTEDISFFLNLSLIKSPVMKTENLFKVFDSNDLPNPEDFIVSNIGRLENGEQNENVDDAIVKLIQFLKFLKKFILFIHFISKQKRGNLNKLRNMKYQKSLVAIQYPNK